MNKRLNNMEVVDASGSIRTVALGKINVWDSPYTNVTRNPLTFISTLDQLSDEHRLIQTGTVEFEKSPLFSDQLGPEVHSRGRQTSCLPLLQLGT
jgi:hypothetical protein